MNKAIGFILSSLDEDYRILDKREDYEIRNIFYRSMELAQKNRILFCFAKALMEKRLISIDTSSLSLKELDYLKGINDIGNLWIQRFNNTLSLLRNTLDLNNIIIIKTFRFYQDVTFDVDIILNKSLPNIDNLFGNFGFALKGINAGHEYKTKSKDYLTIDIYMDHLYKHKRIADIRFVSDSPRPYTANDGCVYRVPSIEAELMLYIAQLNFQNRFITLNDFLQITKMISNNAGSIDWDSVFCSVSKYRWQKGFTNTLSIIASLYYDIYGTALDVPVKMKKRINCSFPYFLSPSSIIGYDREIFGSTFSSRLLINDIKYIFYEVLSFHIRNRLPIYRDWIDLSKLRNI